MCPVNVATRNHQRPLAELRPRTTIASERSNVQFRVTENGTTTQRVGGSYNVQIGHTGQRLGGTGQAVQYSTLAGPIGQCTVGTGLFEAQLSAYILLYKNLRPIRRSVVRGVRYNTYKILTVPGKPTIPKFYIRPTDRKLAIIDSYNKRYITAVGVRNGTANIRWLSNVNCPETNEFFIFIPQIHGFNIPQIPAVLQIFEDHIYNTKCVVSNTTSSERPFQSSETDNTCSLCLESHNPENFVSTNCHHAYCSGCIKHLIQHQHTKFSDPKLYPDDDTELPCPLCRANITKLVFTEKDSALSMRNFMYKQFLTHA